MVSSVKLNFVDINSLHLILAWKLFPLIMMTSGCSSLGWSFRIWRTLVQVLSKFPLKSWVVFWWDSHRTCSFSLADLSILPLPYTFSVLIIMWMWKNSFLILYVILYVSCTLMGITLDIGNFQLWFCWKHFFVPLTCVSCITTIFRFVLFIVSFISCILSSLDF